MDLAEGDKKSASVPIKKSLRTAIVKEEPE